MRCLRANANVRLIANAPTNALQLDHYYLTGFAMNRPSKVTLRRTLNILSLAMIVAYVIFVAARWDAFPSVVPSHFNALGQPDAYGGRWVLLLEPAIALALWALMAVTRRFPGAWNFPVRVTERNRARLYVIGEQMMTPLAPMVVFLLLYIGLMGVYELPVAVLYLVLATVLADIAVGIVRMVRERDA